MKYVFEDNGEDVFSKLFKYAYPEEVSSEFIYSRGSTKIEDTVRPLVKSGECVTVFMDLVPDNAELLGLYRKLVVLSRKNSYRLVLILIPCIEYEFIQSIKGVVNNEFVNRCISYSDYSDLADAVDIDNSNKITTFERYCKAVVKHKILKCMSTNTEVNGGYTYYTKDCLSEDLKDKSLALLRQYPVIPYGIDNEGFSSISGIDLWEAHRRCVDMYNAAVVRFNMCNRTTKCKMIKPIR